MMEDSENNKTNFQHQLPEKCHKARALVQSLNRKVGGFIIQTALWY